MDKMKTNTSGTTHNAGFPPAPSKARQQASYEGQIKTVILNGSKLTERFENGNWVCFKVEAA